MSFTKFNNAISNIKNKLLKFQNNRPWSSRLNPWWGWYYTTDVVKTTLLLILSSLFSLVYFSANKFKFKTFACV